MFTPHQHLQLKSLSFLGAVILFAAVSAPAQTPSSPNPINDSGAAIASDESSNSVPDAESSSNAFVAGFEVESAAPSPAAGHAAAGGQGSGGSDRGQWHHIAFEAGGGFNAPTSDSSSNITWGGNFTVGGGYQFNPHFSTLVEYQFIDDKLPGKLIAETGANGGDAHIWSLTLDPVIDIAPKRSNDLYVTGGGGFYRKVTNFTDPEPAEYCTYFYCGIAYENQVVGHFSSNQGGWSVGGGYIHRLGGVYGDSRMKLFAEVRYLDVLTPATATSPNGLGVTAVGSDTKLVPVTLGVRW
jgi:hypothetical protein